MRPSEPDSLDQLRETIRIEAAAKFALDMLGETTPDWACRYGPSSHLCGDVGWTPELCTHIAVDEVRDKLKELFAHATARKLDLQRLLRKPEGTP